MVKEGAILIRAIIIIVIESYSILKYPFSFMFTVS